LEPIKVQPDGWNGRAKQNAKAAAIAFQLRINELCREMEIKAKAAELCAV
jgi:hypothetical protein